MSIIAFVPDLMDRSRITAVAPEVHFAGSADALVDLVERATAGGQEAPGLALVDLGRPGALDAVRQLTTHGVATVGFASHVDREVLAAGEAAGCGQVLPRSVFFRRLPDLLH